jgi:dihydrofolate reductase
MSRAEVLPGLTLIAAMDSSRLIGAGGQLPWRIPGDLKRFRELTTGHPILMGRKTWDSLGRALPGRTSIVLTRQADREFPLGVGVARDPQEALRLAGASPGAERIFVIGGGEIYAAFLPFAEWLELTFVEGSFSGDAYFPEWDPSQYEETGRFPGEGPVSHVFRTFRRRF